MNRNDDIPSGPPSPAPVIPGGGRPSYSRQPLVGNGGDETSQTAQRSGITWVLNWLQQNWQSSSTTTKVFLIIDLFFVFAQIVPGIVILSMETTYGYCSQPLPRWIILWIIRLFLDIPIKTWWWIRGIRQSREIDMLNRHRRMELAVIGAENISLQIDPILENGRPSPIPNNSTTAAQGRERAAATESATATQPLTIHEIIRRHQSFFVWMRLRSTSNFIYGILFLLANWWLFNTAPGVPDTGIGKGCLESYYFLVLAFVIFGYISLSLPLLMCCSFLFCLPLTLFILGSLGGRQGLEALSPLGSRLNGMKEEDIQRLPCVPFDQTQAFAKQRQQEGDEVECSVCLSKLESTEIVREFSCGHCFHKDCIDSWLKMSQQCPVCRQKVLSSAQDLPQ